MAPPPETQAWLNGAPATAADLAAIDATPFGHFTTLQVRGGATKGLDLHLHRLQAATRELFDQPLASARIRAAMRGALAASGLDDCTLRLAVHARGFEPDGRHAPGPVDLLVRVAPPRSPGTRPLRLMSVAYTRPLPHLKHAATSALFDHRRQAELAGCDDALLVDGAGCIAEGTFWNIGFFDRDRIVWPQAPALRGTCERLLQAGLDQLGVAQATRPVGLEHLAGLQGAFTANSRGVQAVASIDGVAWPPDPGQIDLLQRALDTRPWQPV